MSASAPLFPTLLGPRWLALPASVRALHGGRMRTHAQGIATIDGDRGWPARWLRMLLGFPQPASEVPLEIDIVQTADGETWRRRFAARSMESRLRRSARRADAFEEQLGPARLTFAIDVVAERLLWRICEVRVFGLQLPLRWFRGVQTSCGEVEGRYRFDIDVRLPLVGRLIAYSGWLEVVDDA